MTTFNNSFSKEIYEITYRQGNETIDDSFKRIATYIASLEQDKDLWTKKFIDILSDFKFVPGGRILSNAGCEYGGTTMINCFVSGFTGEDRDSMESIMDELRRQALILKSEGGYGINIDTLRPRGAYIGGIGNETPGAVKMLEMWNTQSSVITEGSGKEKTKQKGKGKIRKGAQMTCISCWHPDVEEFIIAKQTPGRLTKFNMSVLITDDFMKAVRDHKPWNLEFPDIDNTDVGLDPTGVICELPKTMSEKDRSHYRSIKTCYKNYWDGNICKWKESNFPTKIYKTYEDANELWDLLMRSTYKRNEPGVLFVDTINRLNNLYYTEWLNTTNPCGEQALPVGGACNLGNINLTQFIDTANNTWDYNKLKDVIHVAVRFLDNVNDLTNLPLEENKEQVALKRRIGLGIFGYASALTMLGLEYGSKQALMVTEELMDFFTNQAYQASALLALEREPFILYDSDKYLAGEHIKVLSEETLELIKKYGIRNSHLTSTQPTGNCVPITTKIRTSNGIKSMKEIFTENYVDLKTAKEGDWYIPTKNMYVETLNGEKRITGLYVNGKKEVYNISAKNRKITGTGNHRVLVKINEDTAQWKYLKDLKIGDKILVKNDF